MTRELRQRIAKAFYDGAATAEEQDFLNTVAAPAQVQGFADLPEPAQRLLLELEQRGRDRPVV